MAEMKLADKLAKIQQTFEAGDTPSEIVDVLNANVDRLLADQVADRALQIGDAAPLDQVVAYQGAYCAVQDFLKTEFLVLNWFRGNW